MISTINRSFLVFSLTFLLSLVAIPVLAQGVKASEPVQDRVRTEARVENPEMMEQRVEALRVNAPESVNTLSPAEFEARRTEMEARRAELEKQALERRAEREAKAEELRFQVEERREEMQQKRVEFQQEIAEKRIENTNRVILATIERLLSIALRIDSRIDKVFVAGGDVIEAEAYLASARADLDAAKASVAEFANLDLSSDDAQVNFELVRVSAKEAKEHIRSAHQNLRNAVVAVSSQNIADDSNDNESEEEGEGEN